MQSIVRITAEVEDAPFSLNLNLVNPQKFETNRLCIPLLLVICKFGFKEGTTFKLKDIIIVLYSLVYFNFYLIIILSFISTVLY